MSEEATQGVVAKDPEELALEQQLAAASAKLAGAEEKREKARRVANLKAEIAKKEREAEEEDALLRLESELGELGVNIERVDTIDGMVVVKRPDGVKIRKWYDQGKANHDALRAIARPHVVYPDLAKFDVMANDRPVIVDAVASAVLKLGGLKLKELSGK